MRVSRLVLTCSVVGSLLVAPMASPAGAVENCATRYVRAIQNPPPPPPPDDVVYEENGTLHVNSSVVVGYGNALVVYYASETLNYSVCQIAEGLALVNRFTGCITSTPGYQNLIFGSNPHERYVEVVGIDVQVHHGVLLSDALAIVDCV